MGRPAALEELVAEGASVPLDGWDFSWFGGRATEEVESADHLHELIVREGLFVAHAERFLVEARKPA